MDMIEILKRGPVRLRSDNFVPFTRTPWGGEAIGRRFKKDVPPGTKIGEAWEFSCDPSFPSRLDDGDMKLAQLVRDFPQEVCSPALARQGCGGVDILVKLLDTNAPLSLQVHPADDDANLQAGESGKPESWLVLDAAPGAGIYLGFSRPVSREELRAALLDGDKAAALLHFEPVKAGDYFDIEPGVPHAIGPGVTLLEPQRVLPGLSGKTFRMWDWGRRYDDQGRPNPSGKPRELHVEQSLRLIDPERQVGPAFAATLRRQPRVDTRPGVEARLFPANPYYQTAWFRVAADSELRLDIVDGYGALLVLAGEIDSGGGLLEKGTPALLPHAAMPLTLKARSDAELALVTPATSHVRF